MSYEAFEEKLRSASWEERVRLALEGIRDNVITRHLSEIGDPDLNLPTLEIRFPEVYEAIKDKNARISLVLAGLFIASSWKGPKEDLELVLPTAAELNYAVRDCSAVHLIGKGSKEPAYTGSDAVRVLIRSLLALHDEVRSILDLPSKADPWRMPRERDRSAKLKTIMKEMVGMLGRPEDKLVYYLWHQEGLSRNRERLSKLLNLKL